MNLVMFRCSKNTDKSRKMCFVTYFDVVSKFCCRPTVRIYGHSTRLPDFRVIGSSENRLESLTWEAICYSSETRGDRFAEICVHTARFSENSAQKSPPTQ